MKEKIFIDTDVLLDIFLNRDPYIVHSQKILSVIEKNIFSGYTSALIIANCHYIISNNLSKNVADKSISKLRELLTVVSLTDREIGESLNSNFRDFEDGLQYFIAVNNGIRVIITRNVSDYKNVDIDVFTPENFLNLKKIKGYVEKDCK